MIHYRFALAVGGIMDTRLKLIVGGAVECGFVCTMEMPLARW